MRRFVILILFAAASALPAVAQGSAQIAVIDISKVFAESEQGKYLSARLDVLGEQRMKEILNQQQEVIALRKELLTKELTLNREKRNELLQQINQKQADLQRLQERAQREGENEYKRAEVQFLKDLRVLMDTFVNEHSYTLVLEKSQTLWASPTVEITDLVLERFNAQYPVAPPTGDVGGGQP